MVASKAWTEREMLVGEGGGVSRGAPRRPEHRTFRSRLHHGRISPTATSGCGGAIGGPGDLKHVFSLLIRDSAKFGVGRTRTWHIFRPGVGP